MGCANVAATLHKHLCTHSWHGYTQGNGRWGDGEGTCSVVVDGKTYKVEQGDRDCSSSVIDCWRQAIKGTPYEGKLDKATYTGNMRKVFVASGLFTWHPMGDGYVAKRGDIYLNERDHTAMCQSAKPDMLSEFCINEKGTITGGKVGDQTGRESHVRVYYDYPWDGILAYNGKADASPARKVQLYGANGTNAQKWKIEDAGDGYVRLRNVACGKYLDVSGGKSANGTRVQAYPSNTTTAQKWRLKVHDFARDKWCEVESAVKAGMVLDCKSGGTANGTAVQLYPANGTDAQKWALVWAGAANTYYLINLVSGRALDVVNGGK